MAALVLACKQIWGHVRTCATAVKMADLKFYSFKFSFSQFFFSLFLCCMSNTTILVRRLPNTGMEKKNLSETRKFGGKKLMLWSLLPTMFGNVSKKSMEQKIRSNICIFCRKFYCRKCFWAKNCSKITLLHIIRSFHRLSFPKMN